MPKMNAKTDAITQVPLKMTIYICNQAKFEPWRIDSKESLEVRADVPRNTWRDRWWNSSNVTKKLQTLLS